MRDLIQATGGAIRAEVGQEPASWLALADMMRDAGSPEEDALAVEAAAALALAGADSRYEGRSRCQTAAAWLAGDPVSRAKLLADAVEANGRKRPWQMARRDWRRLLDAGPHLAHRRLEAALADWRQPGMESHLYMLLESVRQLAGYKSR